MTKLFDSKESLGTPHQFTFGQDNLTIRRRRWFKTDLVQNIPFSDIREISYVKPKISLFELILLFLLLPLYLMMESGMFPNIQSPNIEIKYRTGNEEALGKYISKISRTNLKELQSIVENYR